jgi:hypothetical protein
MMEMCGNLEVGLPSRATAHYCRRMPAVRRLLAVCALALALVLVALSGTAGAQPYLDIYADFADNGVIDGEYTFSRLQGALTEARQDVLFTPFANAVSDALDAAYLGGSGGAGAGGAASSALPEPRTPDQSGDPPWPLLALSILAGALVVSGAGSSIYRRARR